MAENIESGNSGWKRFRTWLSMHQSVPWIVIPIVIYCFFVVVGITQSSIGVASMRQDPANPLGFQIGHSEVIRSDEYRAWTPSAVGMARTGATDDLNPLTFGPGVFGGSTHGVVSSIVLFDRTLLRLGTVAPVASVFAANWWLPTLLLFLSVPVLFKYLTGNRWLGLFAGMLIYFSPSDVWWSYSPANLLGYAIAGCVLLITACQAWEKRRYVPTALLVLGSGLLLAHTIFQYQPFVAVMVPGVLVPTVLALWARKESRKSNLAPILAAGAMTLIWAAIVFYENRAEFAAMLDTVYPGSRRTTGMPTSVGVMFGAPALSGLAGSAVVGTNQSELSSAFNILIVVVVVLALAGLKFVTKELAWAWRGCMVVAVLWLVWSLVYTGGWSARIPVFNMVVPDRARATVGNVIAILLCMTLAAAPAKGKRRTVVYGTLVFAGLAAWSASDLRSTYLPSITFTRIALTVACVAVMGFLLLWRPRHWAGYVAGAVFAIMSVAIVNPVIVGLGDIDQSQTAKYFQEEGQEARADNTLWATDSGDLAALMRASGVPMLNTGAQSAPDKAVWEVLDPTNSEENSWNRGGGTHIYVTWDDSSAISIASPYPDEIRITTSPCALNKAMPSVTHVASSEPLANSCLISDGTVQWSGNEHYVYSITPQ